MTIEQLTIDGHTVPLERVLATARRGASAEAVLRFAREHGGLVTSSEGGRVKHALRNARLGRWCSDPRWPGAAGCCRYAAGDGREILKRLEELELVERVGHGLYALLEPQERPSEPVRRRDGYRAAPPFVPGAGQ